MYKRILPYELGKVFFLAWEFISVSAIGYCLTKALWFASQLFLAPFSKEFLYQMADAAPAKVQFASKYVKFFATDLTAKEARAALIRYALLLLAGVAVLLLARFLLRLIERGFKQRFMPLILSETFTDARYQAKKRRAQEEILCDVGLLSYVERYYSANRLQGLYRDCWISSQEIVCGGVYGNNYTSYKVKVRGQWVSVRLNTDFDGTLVVESRSTKNRFSRRKIAGRMCEIQPTYATFADRFRCFSDSIEDTHSLLTRQMADKLLAFSEKYPDVCFLFHEGTVYVLIRRRSFDRRWELGIPFCMRHLQTEAARLYTSVLDFTDLLLE